MSEPTKETVDRIRQVAKLRIEGMSWAVIGVKYGYASEHTADSTLTQEHPELWKAEYEAARAKHLDGIEAEALLTQRQLMRPMIEDGKKKSKRRDERIRQSAAHSLLNHTRQLRVKRIELSGEVKAAVPNIELHFHEMTDGEGDNGKEEA